MLKKINNKHSYDNKIPNGYVSHSFEPLPQLWSRINEIIAPKKRIRFSNKITVSRFEVKLPNINSDDELCKLFRRSGDQVRKIEIHK